jgi:hypothetical protein
VSSRTPNPEIDRRIDVSSHGPVLVRDIPGPRDDAPEVEGDHDASLRLSTFPPTLVRACLSVARRAGVLPESPLGAGVDRR